MEGVLAGLALATALKDLVELGVKLKKFCERIANNDEELGRLSALVLSDLQGLQRLYQQDPVGMKQSPELTDATTDLNKKIEAICEKFEIISAGQPKSGSGFLLKFKASFKASDVEREIRFLKEDLLASARITSKVDDLSDVAQETKSGVAKVEATTEQIIVAVEEIRGFMSDQRAKIPEMKSDVEVQLKQYSLQVASPNPPQTTPSRSTTLDSLTHQLDNLSVELPKVAATQSTTDRHSAAHPLVVKIPYFSLHRTQSQRHRRLLRRVLDLLECLEDDATAIEAHAFSLNTLSGYFGHLNMYAESLNVAIWAVDVYRILVRINAQTFEPFLVKALGNLAHYYIHLDNDAASRAINEALLLVRSIDPKSDPQLRYHFAWIVATHGWILYHLNRNDPDVWPTFSTALEVFESILYDVDQLADLSQKLKDSAGLAQQLTSMIVDRKPVPVGDAKDGQLSGYEGYLFVYQWALGRTPALRHFITDQEILSYLLKRAIVLAQLANTYPNTTLATEFATCLLRISKHPKESIPSEYALVYIEESAAIIRRAYQLDSKAFANERLIFLEQLARLLQSEGRRNEAHEVWREVLDVEQLLSNDQLAVGNALSCAAGNLRCLKRHEEAAALRTRAVEAFASHFGEDNIQEATANFDLSDDYTACGRFGDALRVAGDGVHQLCRLFLEDTPQYCQQLSQGLSTFCSLLITSSSNGHPIAIKAVKEVMDQYDVVLQHNISFLSDYMDTMTITITQLTDPGIAMELNLNTIVRLQKLAPKHPEVVPKLQERLQQHASLITNPSSRPNIQPLAEAGRSEETLVPTHL